MKEELQNYLSSIGSDNLKKFNSKIINTKYEILGINIPKLRSIAKSISKIEFLNLYQICDYKTFEEVMLLGLLIGYIKDYSKMEEVLFNFIPYIDNWAISDALVSNLKIIKDNKEKGICLVNKLINSDYEYSVRVGIVILINYYVKEEYIDEIFKIIKEVKIDSYYVNMAISWLLAECFVVDKIKVCNYLCKCNNKFIVNKTISKINDSRKVSIEDKKWIRDKIRKSA